MVRAVLASAGVLGIGADIGRWTPAERDTARAWVADLMVGPRRKGAGKDALRGRKPA